MTSEYIDQSPQTSASRTELITDDGQRSGTTRKEAPADGAERNEVIAKRSDKAPLDTKVEAKAPSEAPREKAAKPAKEVSPAKVRMQNRLPALDDDTEVGVEKDQIVTRDGKADLAFSGVLLASAAPTTAPKGHWQEYRIYQTTGGKHVFSKVTRTIVVDEEDTYEAEVYDPAPTSMPSQLLKSAREMARSKPLTWMDGAVSFFGYDPLAKALYRKLSVQFEEQIS